MISSQQFPLIIHLLVHLNDPWIINLMFRVLAAMQIRECLNFVMEMAQLYLWAEKVAIFLV